MIYIVIGSALVSASSLIVNMWVNNEFLDNFSRNSLGITIGTLTIYLYALATGICK